MHAKSRDMGHRRLPAVVRAVLAAALAGLVLAAPARAADFNPGSAEAAATTIGFAAQAAGAQLGVTYGTAGAKYQNTVAWGRGTAYESPLFALLAGPSCDGKTPPAIAPETLPKALQVDSRDPAAATPRQESVFSPGAKEPGPPVGTQRASSAPGPQAHGDTDVLPVDLGLVGVSNAQSSASVRIVDGNTREAAATTHADEVTFLFGTVVLEDVTWSALTRTGAQNTNEASFTFASATILGEPFTPADAKKALTGQFEQFNSQMRDLGATLEYPKVIEEDGVLQVTPLAIRLLVNAPAAQRSVAPFLEEIAPLRKILFDALIEQDCNNEGTVFILDMGLGILAGSGGIHFEAGGVRVATDDTVFPGALGGTGLKTAGGSPPPGPSRSVVAAATGVSAAAQPATATAAAPPAPEVLDDTFPASAVHRIGPAGIIIGAAGIALALGLAFADRMVMVRNRRTIPDP